MNFPPSFLDDIRARVSLEEVVGRKVKLTRKGRESQGLCPFHNEKTPSFTVSEDKGFYHCFGCGAHGDAFGFEMQAGGLSFPEAVEHLAGLAGVPMPKMTPEERRRAGRQQTLHEVCEAACRWFEDQLRRPTGRAALDYLRRRGLDDAAMARFRLGFAPDSRDGLKATLGARDGGGFSEALLVEAGLLIAPDGGGASYDRFRGRILFPITDRRGQVIAFGARAMGDAQPKYLNSPETPLFHKGHVLYGLAWARDAMRAGGSAVVAEGYMDVIALHRGGFANAVAPLGTAITEEQVGEIWRHAREVILCFDGDHAGLRAAERALNRLLPLLTPEHTARIAILPQGEDPDSLIAQKGAAGMKRVLEDALQFHDALWLLEQGSGRLETPEDFAHLEKRLETAWSRIADTKVRFRYKGLLQARLNDEFRRVTRGKGGLRRRPTRAGQGRLADSHAIQERILLAAIVNHPLLLREVDEALGSLAFSAPELDKLRQEILELASQPDLDLTEVERHLRGCGYEPVLDRLRGEDVYLHAGFVRPDTALSMVRLGWKQALARYQQPIIQAQLDEARRAWTTDATPEAWSRLELLQKQRKRIEATAVDEDELTAGAPQSGTS